MKRSEINNLVRAARRCFEAHGWALPPDPKWEVTDFGLGDLHSHGLLLVNLAEEQEYCEKLMYARKGMTTPSHCHRRKKEDIIARWGTLSVRVWPVKSDGPATIAIDGRTVPFVSGEVFELKAGSRITLVPGVYHEFSPVTDECIIGEVSTANDDLNDNIFLNPNVSRFPQIDEDVPAIEKLSTKF
jgi:D-lyxose ketol-isomerase